MTFVDSIQTCFKKYVEFNGVAKRSEFWWFFLFVWVVSIVLSVVNQNLSYLWSLATLLPFLAVGARRLHDTGKSGWLQLLWIIPVIGWIILIVLLALPAKGE